jgi:hypothetical protein
MSQSKSMKYLYLSFFVQLNPVQNLAQRAGFFPPIGKGVLCEVAIYPFIDNPYTLNEHQELRMF